MCVYIYSGISWIILYGLYRGMKKAMDITMQALGFRDVTSVMGNPMAKSIDNDMEIVI